MMDYGTLREYEKEQDDLSVLFGVNPLPISVIPKVMAEYKKRFQLRTEILISFPEQERREMYRIVGLDRVGLKEVLAAETFQSLMERVHAVYERVLSGQVRYERWIEKEKLISKRTFEWTDKDEIFLQGLGNDEGWVSCKSVLEMGR